MNNIKRIYKQGFLLLIVAFSFNGCFVSFFTIGEQETFQEMYGQQYKNCGTNASFVDLLEDTDFHSAKAYERCIIYRDDSPWWKFGFGKDKYEEEDERRLKLKNNKTYFQNKYGGSE